MRLIVGAGTGGEWLVRDLDHTNTNPPECDVYWPAEYWPEVEALVRFDHERERLHLPTLEDAEWQ